MTGADQSSISDPRLTSGSASEPPTGHELSVALTKVAAEPSSSSADADLPKTPFLDDDGHPMLNYIGKRIMRSAERLDPHDLIAKGEALRQEMMPQPFLDSPDAAATAVVHEAACTPQNAFVLQPNTLAAERVPLGRPINVCIIRPFPNRPSLHLRLSQLFSDRTFIRIRAPPTAPILIASGSLR